MPRRRLLIALSAAALAAGCAPRHQPRLHHGHRRPAVRDVHRSPLHPAEHQARPLHRRRTTLRPRTTSSAATSTSSSPPPGRPGQGRHLLQPLAPRGPDPAPPSVKEFTKCFKAFKKRYPEVSEYSPWNEATTPPAHAQEPQARGRVLRRAQAQLQGVHDRGAGRPRLDERQLDDQVHPDLPEVRQEGQAKDRGLHNYSDTNRFRNKGTKAILKVVKGDLWLTETGGVVKFGSSFPFDEQRAAKALDYPSRSLRRRTSASSGSTCTSGAARRGRAVRCGAARA